MNEYKLYVFGEKTDTYEELEIETNDMLSIFSLENIQDITTRKDNITRDIIIKGTQNNNRILGNLYDISRYSSSDYAEELQHNFVANKTVKCMLLENNIQIIKGSLLVKEIAVEGDNINYSCGILGNLVTFFSNLKERELHELDSLNDNVQYSLSNIQDSWNNYNSNYLFPNIDYGVDEREGDKVNYWDNNYDVKNYRPAIYVKNYMDAIFRGFKYDETNKKYTQLNTDGSKLNNYSYTTSLNNLDSYNKAFIPNNQEFFTIEQKGVYSTINNNGGNYTRQQAPPIFAWNILDWKADSNYTTKFYEKYKVHNDVNNGVLDFHTLIPLDKNITTSLTLTFKVELSNQMRNGRFKIGLFNIKDGAPLNEESMFMYQVIEKTTGVQSQLQTFYFNQTKDDVAFNGEYVIGWVYLDSLTPMLNTSNGVFLRDVKLEVGKANIITKKEVVLGENFKLNETIPRGYKVIDFLKSIMTLYNLYIIENPQNENNFIIEPYNNFYKDVINLNRNIAEDWTHKIDFKNYKLLTNIQLPKSYQYKYTEDNDILNDTYKNRFNKSYGELTINDSKGFTDKKEVSVIFAPTINISTSANNKKLPVVYKGELGAGKKKPFNSKIRIMYNNGIRTAGTYNIHYRGKYLIEQGNYQYSSMLYVNNNNKITDTLLFDIPNEYFTNDDITDDTTISTFNKYHSTQLTNLIDDNLIIMECSVNLNETDISNLDFKKPIYLQTKYGNSYFKLIEVEYINNNNLATVKLMKIVK